jgi:hypothetical protein
MAGAWTHGILQGLGGDGKHYMIYMYPPAIKHGNMATAISFQTTGDFLGKCLIHLQIFMGFFRPKIWSSEKKNLFGGANGYAGGPGLQGHLLHLSESIGIYRIIASFPNPKMCCTMP